MNNTAEAGHVHMHASAHCNDGTDVKKIWHRMDAGGHKHWELTGVAVGTFHEAQIMLYKISHIVSSYRFIYLLVV